MLHCGSGLGLEDKERYVEREKVGGNSTYHDKLFKKSVTCQRSQGMSDLDFIAA